MSVVEIENNFVEIIDLIRNARENAFKAVNTELINLYWKVGEIISHKIETTVWGMKVVDRLADFICATQPDIKGFNRRGLYRMKQFYQTYRKIENVSSLLTQIPWSCHLHILSKTKSIEEKEFYLRLTIKEKLTVRELERQIDSAYFERVMLSPQIVSTALTQLPNRETSIFKDTYIFEFLDLPDSHSERLLQKALLTNLKQFILEFGRDFSFVGENFRIQVGGDDYYIDLLFYHRELSCLVAIELKIDGFKPEYSGKMDFYLEALDRDIKKKNENPSVGLILCKSKNSEIVEYAMSRTLSPTMISEYKTKLIDKKLLERKINEFYNLSRKDDYKMDDEKGF